MSFSPIGRGRFFLYAAPLAVLETVACLAVGASRYELVDAAPGPERVAWALSCFAVRLVFLIPEGIVAARRVKDSELGWNMLWAYIGFSLIYAIVEALELATYVLETGTGVQGAKPVGFIVMGLWGTIWMAKPRERGPWGGRAPAKRRAPPREPAYELAAPSYEPVARHPVAEAPRRGFGRRGA